MTLATRLSAAAYLFKRLVLKDEVQRFAPAGAPAPRPSAPPEHGVVDEVAAHTVRGWARRVDEPDVLVHVDIYLDDAFVGRAACNRLRGDLSNLRGFHPSGRHGFEFPLPEPAGRLGGRLRVVAADSGLELSGSPVELARRVPADVVDVLPELMSKVWYPGTLANGVVSLTQMEAAYGRRLSTLTQIDPEAADSGWPVTRAMAYVNARNHAGRLPFNGSQAYFELLLAAAAHFAGARAGLPMDAKQVEALTRPTGWLLAGQVRSTMILDAFARVRRIETTHDEAFAADFLTDFVVEVLAGHRLPIDLLGGDALAFLAAALTDAGATRFEAAFARSPMFAKAPPASESATTVAAVRLAAWDIGLELLTRHAGPVPEPSPASETCRQGVRIITGDHGESGLSQNARNSLAALNAIGVDTQVDAAPLSTLSPFTSYDHFARPSFSTVLIHLPPHDAVEVILRLPAEQASAWLVGFFMWETETLPDAHHLGALLVDEIWTGSHYCDQIFSAAAPSVPVHMVGHAVQAVEPEAGFDARAFAGVGPDDFVFLFHFDAHSWITRKNPTAVVRAFRRAFAPHQTNVRLVVKLRRSEDWDHAQWRHWWAEFFEEAGADERIVLVRETLSGARMAALTQAADAYVSLHRSEGFGYGLAEAMLAGKPTIASDYSGNLDFTRPGEALLVQATRRPIREGEFLYAGPAQVWAEPDVDAAASAMRTIFTDRPLAARLGRGGRERIEKDCSLQALAERYARILQSHPSHVAQAGGRKPAEDVPHLP